MSFVKKYKSPPLVEAVFELFFQAENWSFISMASFYAEIKDQFPEIGASKNGIGITINDGNGLILGEPENKLAQFKNISGDTVIQLSNSLLTVNKLPKYDCWESYLKTIQYILTAFNKTVKTRSINRFGLKMLNKVDVGEIHSYDNFLKHFKVYPVSPNSTRSLEMTNTQFQFEFSLDSNHTEFLALSFLTGLNEPEMNSPVIFQLYRTKMQDGLEISDISNWLEAAHSSLTTTFEDCITDYCRETFNNE